MKDYKVHNVTWDNEKVGRFWDFYNNYDAFEDLWFSKTMGQSIVNFLGKIRPLKGEMLDYGIGKGHLAQLIVPNYPVSYYACDFSQETVNNINKKFESYKNFKGCSIVKNFPSDFESEKFDFVLLIEAIEHLTDEYLETTILEAKRILKPGGILVVTTPNDENLDFKNVICPDCGCVFHRVQHVRKFTTKTLSSLMAGYGISDVYCKGIDLKEFGKNGWAHVIENKMKSFFTEPKKPHLVFLGAKK